MLSSLAKSLAEGKTFAGGKTGAADSSQGAAGVPANGSNFFVMATGQVQLALWLYLSFRCPQ